MTMCFCYGCGIQKDPEVEEMYTGENLCNTEPISPLLVLDCQGYHFDGHDWKSVIVCFDCFDKLNPDHWISRYCWEGINPHISFDELPKLCGADFDWDPVKIEELRSRTLKIA